MTVNVMLLLEKHEQEMDQQLEHFLVDEFSTQIHDNDGIMASTVIFGLFHSKFPQDSTCKYKW